MARHSAGETAMGYVDGLLTLEQTMSVAYYRSLCGASTVDPKNPGARYAVGLPAAEAQKLIKENKCQFSAVACDNDPGLATLSGSEAELELMLQKLGEEYAASGKKFFCRKVPTFGVAYHSKMLEPGLEILRKQLESVIDDKPYKGRPNGGPPASTTRNSPRTPLAATSTRSTGQAAPRGRAWRYGGMAGTGGVAIPVDFDLADQDKFLNGRARCRRQHDRSRRYLPTCLRPCRSASWRCCA